MVTDCGCHISLGLPERGLRMASFALAGALLWSELRGVDSFLAGATEKVAPGKPVG